MSLANVEIVRRMFERWNAGDIEGWLSCWHTDAEWISEPFAAFEGSSRTYRGHGELCLFPVHVQEGFADMGRIERPEFRDLGDAVIVLADYVVKAEVAGPETVSPMAWLLDMRDGKIKRGRDFLDQRKALEAAGLRE